MRVRELYKRERPKWSRSVLALWAIVAYLALLYAALRWGGGSTNLLPSAD